MKILTLLAIALVSLPGVSSAESLAFDFDIDDDPGTIDPDITAEVGDVVLAYLVVNEIPAGFDYVYGLEFGLGLSDGLDFRGMSVVGLQGAMATDGTNGWIVVTLDEPIPASEFPSFVVRFALKVTEASEQTARITPSTRSDGGFVYYVSSPDAGLVTVEDVQAIEEQTIGRVNVVPTPTQIVSWGELKTHF